MPGEQNVGIEPGDKAVLEALHHHWGAFLIEGILLLILGMLAIAMPALASLAATVFFGWILLISGFMGLITTLKARRAPGFAWSLVSAILGIAAGGVLLWFPVNGVASLTAVLIVFLVIEGVASILYAIEHRKALSGRWIWMLVSGLIDLALALMLLTGLPGTASWAVGLIIGINMLFGGWALIGMALHARSAAAGSPAAAPR
jgi:uncharacterized membrane protein HdeD (DUF308 family)